MKKIAIIAVFVTSTFLVGCAGTGVGSLGAGSDSAYTNANRGRSDAQMSKAQEDQYNRQQRVAQGELTLEQQKQNAQRNQVTNMLGEGQSVLNFARQFMR